MTTERTTRGGERRATEPTRDLPGRDRPRGARRDRPRGAARAVAALAGLAALLADAALAACGAAPPRLHPVFPAGPAAEKPRGKILFVLSAARVQTLGDGAKRATGTFLGELYEPYLALTGAGYEVVFATAGGAAPALSIRTCSPSRPAGRLLLRSRGARRPRRPRRDPPPWLQRRPLRAAPRRRAGPRTRLSPAHVHERRRAEDRP
ncbi:uncharacterized protein SOCEGT47_027800 [Sorangium cellulosum]|uniref:Uncharacterized protein n=1 Tax=Sorangium cellulosum TaxID=56 RepID=A0A4P2PZE5_SORCE|nr:uncharacterized protein SOCEGT47_027800 [Sorangium cellulosum]